MAEFRQANQSLVALAQRDLADFWSALNPANPDTARDALLEFFPDLVSAYGDTAAVLGADWYDLLRDAPPSVASFDSVIAQPAPIEQAQGSVRWAVGPLFTEEPDVSRALANLMGSAQRLVLQPGRDGVYSSAASDPFLTGVARIPSGLETCKFCIMLASRGPVYQSQVSAELVVGRGSNRTGYDAAGRRLTGGIGGGVKARGALPIASTFHDDCDCVPTVIRGPADYPDGYDVETYRKLYAEGSGQGRDLPPST